MTDITSAINFAGTKASTVSAKETSSVVSSIETNAKTISDLTKSYHDEYNARREADTKWHQQQMVFAHNLYTTPSPKVPARSEASAVSLALLDYPALLGSLAQNPELWERLKTVPEVYARLCDNPERFKDLLDNHKDTLQILISHPGALNLIN
jgi:hypothetical protein